MKWNPLITAVAIPILCTFASCRKEVESTETKDKAVQSNDIPKAEPEMVTPTPEESEDDNKPSTAPEDAAPNVEEPPEG